MVQSKWKWKSKSNQIGIQTSGKIDMIEKWYIIDLTPHVQILTLLTLLNGAQSKSRLTTECVNVIHKWYI